MGPPPPGLRTELARREQTSISVPSTRDPKDSFGSPSSPRVPSRPQKRKLGGKICGDEVLDAIGKVAARAGSFPLRGAGRIRERRGEGSQKLGGKPPEWSRGGGSPSECSDPALLASEVSGASSCLSHPCPSAPLLPWGQDTLAGLLSGGAG